ncbi:MAG: hypothetical protein WD599_04055 [Balneolaceae bacterium]
MECIKYVYLLLIPVLLLSCNALENDNSSLDYQYDFSESDHNFEAFFTDYNVGWGEKMNLHADYRTLPEPLDTTVSAHYIRGVNHSDDVKMMFRRQIDGLKPNTTYHTRFTVRFATSVPSNCAGIGGAPGESVKVIAAASELKPEPFIEEEPNEYYRLNLQHQNDSKDWYQNAIMGDIANSRDCEEGPQFEIKEVSSKAGHDQVTTDENGQAWLLFGTRSGFEGRTDLYYTFFRAEFNES